jgi:hypothetical protein
MENSDEMLGDIVRLLKAFYLMKGFNVSSGTPYYRKAIILQMMIFLYIKKYGLPAWEMFLENLAVYNEESGEISFSILSRCVLGDTMKFDFDHLNKMYRMMNVYLQCRDAVAEDSHGKTIRSRSHQSHDVNSVEVQTTIAHFKNTINKMRCGQFRWYVEGPKCYPNSTAGDKYAEEKHVDKIYHRKFKDDVKDDITKMKDAFNPRFAQADLKSWPRSLNEAFDSDEDSPLKSDGDDDDEKLLSEPDDDSDDEPLGQREPANDPQVALVNQRVLDSDDDVDNEAEEKGSGAADIEHPLLRMPGGHNHAIVVTRQDGQEELIIEPGDIGRSIAEIEDDEEGEEPENKGGSGNESDSGDLSEAALKKKYPDGSDDPEDVGGPCAWDGMWFPIREVRSKKKTDDGYVYRVRFVGPYQDETVAEDELYGADKLLLKMRKKKRKRR